MKKAVLIFVCIPFLMAFQCDEDDIYCTDEIYEPETLESIYNCTNTKYDMNINLDNTYITIGDQNTFENLVSGNCLPEIDFSAYSLVIGKQGLTSGNTSIAYLLKRYCYSEDADLEVKFIQNATTEAPNLTYHALIPSGINIDELNVDIIIN